ncbi:cysteine desulfurase NifS [Candidatus Micrarchaeota archaeon]|nr:cysteine desulfurase NifS [Candidatus Micrarchaeota archaeon]
MKRIYLDHASTTPADKEVVRAMLPFFTKKFGNASSVHGFGLEAREELEKARESIAKKINANPEEIVFTSGGSESDNLALKGIAFSHREKGNQIITSSIEHPAVLGACNFLEGKGFKVAYLKVDKEGFIDLNELSDSINDKTILVSLMHANNEIGTIQELDKIGKICSEKEVLFHSDAVQSFTKVPIDVKKTSIDLISFSSHKIHGPKGVGALFIRKGTPIEKEIHGGHHEFNKRAGTENVPGAIGFGKAVELAKEKHVQFMNKLRDYLIKEIEARIPNSKLNGPKGKNRLCNNINFSFAFIEGESLLNYLNLDGIAVSTGSACSSQSLAPSHVLNAIGLPHEIIHGSIRMSLGRENTKKEMDFTIKSLIKNVKKLREMSPLKEGMKYDKEEFRS